MQIYFIGVDISKNKLDIAVLSNKLEVFEETVILNTDSRLRSYLTGLLKKRKVTADEILVCCENTGIYNRPLERICHELGVPLWVEHPVKIKRASTDMRGKNDRQDALRIAKYAIRYEDCKVLHQQDSDSVKKLKALTSMRDKLVSHIVAIENEIREAKSHDPDLFKLLKSGYRSALKQLESDVKKIEKQISDEIDKTESIKQNVDLLTSIPGIGKVTAIEFVIATNNFKNFESAKHLACYAGVVPFQNQSGTIIKRERVSKMANQKLKKLLHLAAMSVRRCDPNLKDYFIRKVKEGKNKMSVLNAIRNKLVHRIMAVITRRTAYIRSESDFFYQKEKILFGN